MLERGPVSLTTCSKAGRTTDGRTTADTEWTDATWNPVTGCSVVSPGCTNCYAMRQAGTRLRDHPSRAGLDRAVEGRSSVWNGQVRFNADWLTQPLRWKRPRRIFVCAHGDLFHEAVPDAWIDQVFAVMAAAHWHTFQVLTKRGGTGCGATSPRRASQRRARYLSAAARSAYVPAERRGDDLLDRSTWRWTICRC